MPSFLASSLSFFSRPSSSLQKTTTPPMRADLFLMAASSSFLTKLVKLSLISRAKIMATGEPPSLQTWQARVPACFPVTLSGLNGVIFLDPTGGPDLRSSAADRTLHVSSAAARDVPSAMRFLMLQQTSRNLGPATLPAGRATRCPQPCDRVRLTDPG